MNPESPSVVYLLPDAIGGVASMIGNLLRYRRSDDLQYHVLLTRDLSRVADSPVAERLAADSQRYVVFERYIDNFERILRRVYESIPAGEGVAVANDWLDLAALARHNCDRTILQILHGDIDYYYDLASRYDPIVDGYITHTRLIYEKLQRLLPHRRDTIFHLPYGVPIPLVPRTASNGTVRLLFVGRLVEAKGIYELPAIDKALLARGVQPRWTIVGSGTDGDKVRTQWTSASVRWTGALPNSDVLPLYREHDVLVLPTRMEGFPVTLLEAMAAGVVPVVSDLPGGIQQAVQPGVTGYLHPFSDVDGFAASIADLHHDRAKLEEMSTAARCVVREEFDIEKRVSAYQDLFARWRELRRPRPQHLLKTDGSRLDKDWIPNWLVRTIHSITRRPRGPARNPVLPTTRPGSMVSTLEVVSKPRRPVTIVVLGKYRKVFRGFLKSSQRFAASIPKVLVRDGAAIPDPAGWTVIQGPETFSMAGNGNLGLRAVATGSDVLYCGDDVRFVEEETVERLSDLAHRHPEIGILSPRLRGRGSRPQLNPSADIEYIRPSEMWFPCVYIKREVLDRVGFLDERFHGYGSDDLDFCLRAEMAGYKLAVTQLVTVCHEHGGGGPTTFLKSLGKDTWQQQKTAAAGKLCAKWGVNWETLAHCLETGDYRKLVPQGRSEPECHRDQAQELLPVAAITGPSGNQT